MLRHVSFNSDKRPWYSEQYHIELIMESVVHEYRAIKQRILRFTNKTDPTIRLARLLKVEAL